MPKDKHDAYSLFCQSLDLMSSAVELGSNFARTAATELEQWPQPWDPFSVPSDRDEPANEERQPPTAKKLSAIEQARQAVNRNLGVKPTEKPMAKETEAAAPVAQSPAPTPPTSPAKPPSPPQADHLDDRAKRLLARFVDPDPDFFERSPFEDWDAFPEPPKQRKS